MKEFIWFFQNCAPRGTKVFFYSNSSIVKESVCQDGLITNNDHKSLQDSRYSKLGNFFIFHFFGTEIYSLFRNINKMTKWLKHKFVYFMHMLTLKQGLHFSKVHSEMKTFMNKSKEIAPNWSFILMLLMTTNKFSEFDRICVDQGSAKIDPLPCLWKPCNSPRNTPQLLHGIHIWHWHRTFLDMDVF